MPITYRYVYMHNGDNEWLANPANCDEEGWDEAWDMLKEGCTHHIDITEEIYNNQEYGEIPNWIDVTIKDEGVLPLKLARNLVNGIDGATSINFLYSKYIEVVVSPEWGGMNRVCLEVGTQGSAWVLFSAKHAGEEVEVSISEQLRHALGE
jgi:hypothetical protein